MCRSVIRMVNQPFLKPANEEGLCNSIKNSPVQQHTRSHTVFTWRRRKISCSGAFIPEVLNMMIAYVDYLFGKFVQCACNQFVERTL